MPAPTILSHRTTYGSTIIGSEKAYTIEPPAKNEATRLILSFHYTGGSALWTDPFNYSGAAYAYAAHIAAHGFVFVSSLWSGDWTSDAQLTAIDGALTWGAAQGIDTTKVGLFGASGGGLPALNWWRLNPTKVGAAVLFVPVVHIPHLYDDNAPLQAAMDANWGGDAKANGLPYSPHTFGASLAGTAEALIYNSSDDAAIRDADVEAFAAAAGATLIDTGPGGHGDLANFDPNVDDMVRVFEALR